MLSLQKDEQALVEQYLHIFTKILKNCLKAKTEQILIVTDEGTEQSRLAPLLASGYYGAAQKKGLSSTLLVQEVKKGFMQADIHVVKAITSLPRESVVIVAVSNKLGRFGEHKSFRRFCKEQGHRFVSASGLGDAKNNHFQLFMEAMNCNYARMRKLGDKIKRQWDKAKEIRVVTPAGTDLVVDVEGMQAIANTAEYFLPGMGGNVPAGEVYIAPRGMEGCSGVVVLDGSIRHESGSKLLSYQLTLHVEKGRVVRMEGPEAEILENTFQKFEDRAKYPERVRLVGELGIGINQGAVLIGLALMDEKVSGTAHVGIGSNAWFGGAIKTIFHGDMTFKNPKFYVDGKELKM